MSNSAQRLHDALSNLRGASSNQTAIDVWPGVFQLSGATRSQILIQIGEFLALVEVVKSEVADIAYAAEMSQELLSEWVPQLDDAIQNFTLEGPISRFAGRITDTLLYGLRICAALFERHRPEKIISLDDVQELSLSARALRQEALDAPISSDLKSFVVDRLGDVIAALDAYPILGVSGLESSFERLLGSMIRHPQTWEKVGAEPIGKKIFKYVKKMGAVLTFVWTAMQIGDRVQNLLHEQPDLKSNNPSAVASEGVPPAPTRKSTHKRNIEI